MRPDSSQHYSSTAKHSQAGRGVRGRSNNRACDPREGGGTGSQRDLTISGLGTPTGPARVGGCSRPRARPVPKSQRGRGAQRAGRPGGAGARARGRGGVPATGLLPPPRIRGRTAPRPDSRSLEPAARPLRRRPTGMDPGRDFLSLHGECPACVAGILRPPASCEALCHAEEIPVRRPGVGLLEAPARSQTSPRLACAVGAGAGVWLPFRGLRFILPQKAGFHKARISRRG